MTNLNLKRLSYFVAVAEELHFTRAAARLGIAQPPLSQQIRLLEQELGTPLLKRTKRQVLLTAAGAQLLTDARRLLDSASRLRETTQRAARGEIGRLRLAFVSSVLYSVLPQLLRALHHAAPDLQVSLRDLPSAEVVRGLLANSFDVGFVRLPVHAPNILTHTIRRERFVMALPADHPLAQKPVIDLKDAAAERFLVFPRQLRPELYDAIVSMCQRGGFHPQIIEHDVSPQQVALALVAAGIGVTLLPESFQVLAWPGVTYRPLKRSPIEVDLALAWQKQTENPAANLCVRIALTLFKP